jgi:quinol-cytochrome oxidoreductase complex cytochrome b subunit
MAETTQPAPEKDTIPFYPDHVSTEARVVLYMLVGAVVLGLIGLLLPVGLGTPADPMDTPAHVKPEWYFLALYQVLKYVPKTFGASLFPLAIILLAIWPFFDRKPDTQRSQKMRAIASAVVMIVLIALTIWGEVS